MAFKQGYRARCKAFIPADVSLDADSDLTLHRQQERLLECFRDPAQEAGSVGAVNQAMIVGKRERQNQPRLEFAIQSTPAPCAIAKAENRNLGMIDDRRKPRAADASEICDGERPALHVREA